VGPPSRMTRLIPDLKVPESIAAWSPNLVTGYRDDRDRFRASSFCLNEPPNASFNFDSLKWCPAFECISIV